MEREERAYFQLLRSDKKEERPVQKLSSIASMAERKPGMYEVTEIKRREYFREVVGSF